MSYTLDNFKEVAGRKWSEQLEPLFETSYFDNILEMMNFVYGSDPIIGAVPSTSTHVLMPLRLTSPEKIHTVIINNGPAISGSSNGIGFGSNTEMSLTLKRIQTKFQDRNAKISIDPTLVSWLRQGVLVLNWSPILQTGSITTAGVFSYLYKNIISILSSMSPDIVLASPHRFITNEIKGWDVPDNVHIVAANDYCFIDIDTIDGNLLFDEIDETHRLYNIPPVKWFNKI